jgi:L,D-peptidoglycan transpeptidase YkuD (ErfK/YbiS/YcfS/YnhG family)
MDPIAPFRQPKSDMAETAGKAYPASWMMPRRSLLIQLAALTGTVSRARAAALTVPDQCRQLVSVIATDWNATAAILRRWQRPDARSPWSPADKPVPVVLGRAGLRPGRGLHPAIPGRAAKQEGDGCSPAGLFSLDTAFGTAPRSARPEKWPWLPMTSHHAGVDDPGSRHYNRIVDRRAVQPDWTSAENMIPDSGVYRLGLVVRHNWDQKPGAGSCIFLHIRDRQGSPTAGCTAMEAAQLASLLQWLQPAAAPLLLQLPQAIATQLPWLPPEVL